MIVSLPTGVWFWLFCSSAALLLWMVMTLLRQPAHRLLLRLGRLAQSQFRLLARSLFTAAHRVRLRNHEVVNALARELMERRLERDFMRIEALVEKDLAHYQTLAAAINQQISDINRDFEASALTPPLPPQWIEAVDAIAGLELTAQNSDVIQRILADIHHTVKEHQREAMREHRWQVGARHRLLSNLRPHWRKLGKVLQQVGGNIESLDYRLRHIDQQMERYEALQASPEHGIMASVLVRCLVSTLFVVAGAVAASVLFVLVDKPLGQLLPLAVQQQLPLSAWFSALFLVMLLSFSALALDGLRLTHLLPLMAAMTQRGRMLLIGVAMTALVTLSTLAAIGVAYYSTASNDVMALQSVSGAILLTLTLALCLLVALVVIPLEYMLYTLRPTLGVILQWSLQLSGVSCRLVSALAMQLSRVLVIVYDLIVYLPRRWQNLAQGLRQQRRRDQAEESTAIAVQAEPSLKGLDADNVAPFTLIERR